MEVMTLEREAARERNYRLLTKVVRRLSQICLGFDAASLGIEGDVETMTVTVRVYPVRDPQEKTRTTYGRPEDE